MTNDKNPLLSLIKTDDNGNKWYCFRDLGDMPYLRSLVADMAKRFDRAKITKENLTELLQLQKKTKDIAEKDKIADEIILRTNHLSEEGCLMELCCVYFILNDENPDVYNKVAAVEKQKLINADYKLKCFFLYWLQQTIPIFPDISIFDIVEYLELPKQLKDEIAMQLMSMKK